MTENERIFDRLLREAFPSQAINQIKTKEGHIAPKAPCGIAVPQGWALVDEGKLYVRDK